MVGVPGRSKACVTCRKRRKGCDFGRPTCAQCRKQGLKCGGYENQRVFVVSTPDARQAGYSVTASTSDAIGAPPSQDQNPPSGPRSWSAKKSHRCPTVGYPTSKSNLIQLSRAGDEQRCLDSFWEAYFPSGNPIPATAIRSYTCAWAETARRAWQNDDSLRYALWANSLLMTGRRNGEEWMVRESSTMYGKALSSLRKVLSVSQGVEKDTSIATVKLLSMFEALTQPDKGSNSASDWQRHNAGELALIVARTPQGLQDGDAHHIYADERVEMALSSILQRKRLILSSPDWKTVPWQTNPKNLKDILVDVLVDMPGLVEDFDTMVWRLHHLDSTYSSSPGKHAAAAALASTIRTVVINKCREHDRQLLEWTELVLQLPRQPPPEPPHADGETGGKPQCIAPPGSSDADGTADISQQALIIHVAKVHGMVLYWISALVLYTIMQTASTAYLSFEPRPPHAGPALSDEALASDSDIPGASILAERFNPLTHASHLVDAISILLQPCSGLYGHRSAALPLEVALEYVSKMDPETGAHGDVSEIQDLHGVRLGTGDIEGSRAGDVKGMSRGEILEKLRELKKRMERGIES